MKNIRKFYGKYKGKVANVFVAVLFVALFLLVFINAYNIQFFANGFTKLAGKGLQVYFLDVGQANATLIILPTGRTLIVDTGSEDSSDDFMVSVEKILSSNGLEDIDILVLTHSDEDHIGGTVKLLEEYQVHNIYRPKVLSASETDESGTGYYVVDTNIYDEVISAVWEEPNCEVEFIEDMVFFEGDDYKIEIFSCEEDFYSDTNSYSPFVYITYAEKSFLLTGDASEAREEELVSSLEAEGRDLKVDFLLVSHHGSRSSTTSDFLAFVKPRYAIISAGDSLHPTQDVLDRLEESGVSEIYCTKTDGMIGVGVESSGVFVLKTMDTFIDLPLIFCIIFVVGMAWYDYFTKKRRAASNFR